LKLPHGGFFILSKCEKEIGKEIPEHDYHCGYCLGDIEIISFLLMQKPNDGHVKDQAYKCEENEFPILNKHIWVLAGKCPHAIDKKIATSGRKETHAIGQVLIQFDFLFDQIGEPKIND
jgi:hypothetical protein